MIRFCSRFFLLNYMDRTEVLILSSVSSGSAEDDKSGKPAVIREYNRVMPCVDLDDQHQFGRPLPRRKVKKYYRDIFYHMFDIALVDALIYFKQIPAYGFSKMTRIKFRLLLIRGLFEKYPKQESDPTLEQHNDNEEADNLEGPIELTEQLNDPCDELHLPVHVDKRPRCAYCKDGRAQYMCTKCKVPLCVSSKRVCFTQYHKELAEDL